MVAKIEVYDLRSSDPPTQRDESLRGCKGLRQRNESRRSQQRRGERISRSGNNEKQRGESKRGNTAAQRELATQQPRAKSRMPRAKSQEPRAESQETSAECRAPRAESRVPRAKSQVPRQQAAQREQQRPRRKRGSRGHGPQYQAKREQRRQDRHRKFVQRTELTTRASVIFDISAGSIPAQAPPPRLLHISESPTITHP